MSDPSPEDLAEADRWMQEAEEELTVAARIAAAPDLPGRIACFHSHLAAEKAIKSLQIRCAIPVRKIHNLVQLVRELPDGERRRFAAEDLNRLTPWTIDGRYPTDHEAITETESGRVLQAAGRVVAAVRGSHPDRGN
jgi:HEPN domain-containing protein